MPNTIARRELLKMASATLVGLTTGRLSGGLPRELVENVVNAEHWTPVFLNQQQDETVIGLTDLIIPRTDTPGAKDAKVNRYVDVFLAVKDTEEQKDFVAGLAGLDAHAKQTYKKDFVSCTEKEQTDLLGRMERGNSGFFRQVKTLTSLIYFNTPEGYKELNKFGPPKGVVAGTVVCET